MAVTLHTYTKTEYKDAPAHKTTPLSAANLNNNEDGTEQLYTDLAAVYKQQQDDLTNVSQTGSTASQAISAGTYFYLDGTLVKAKTAIASGATFTENTNYEVVTDGVLNYAGGLTLKTYSNVSVGTSGSLLGKSLGYGDIDLSSDAALYGTPISVTAQDNAAVPCITMINASNYARILSISSYSASRTATVYVLYSKGVAVV